MNSMALDVLATIVIVLAYLATVVPAIGYVPGFGYFDSMKVGAVLHGLLLGALGIVWVIVWAVRRLV